MAKVKTNIRIDEDKKIMSEYLAEESNINFSRYIEEALQEKIENDMLLRRGGAIIKMENPQMTPKINLDKEEKDFNVEILRILVDASNKLNEMDPLGIGCGMNEFFKYVLQRLSNDDKKTMEKFMTLKTQDEQAKEKQHETERSK